MKKAPAMPLFGDAYLADTRHLSLEEHGAYLQLLLIAWRSPDCTLPNDDKRLAMMLGISAKRWASIRPQVMAFWSLSDAGWQQKRLTKERRWVAKKSEDNRSAAHTRWNAKSLETNGAVNANAMPNGCKNDAPPPSPLEEKEERGRGDKSPAYAFFGQTIRLAPRHFNEWKRLFHSIPDLEAELSTIDGWWQLQPEADRKDWFFRTKRMLNNKHQQNLAIQKQEAAPVWDGMP